MLLEACFGKKNYFLFFANALTVFVVERCNLIAIVYTSILRSRQSKIALGVSRYSNLVYVPLAAVMVATIPRQLNRDEMLRRTRRLTAVIIFDIGLRRALLLCAHYKKDAVENSKSYFFRKAILSHHKIGLASGWSCLTFFVSSFWSHFLVIVITFFAYLFWSFQCSFLRSIDCIFDDCDEIAKNRSRINGYDSL